ncbi:adenylate kinase [Colletotrichum caudatum]|nr:adenylate kinase [Colletotrichum caudatum]
MKANSDTPLASTIQDRLDNQGFLTSAELNPFLGLAIKDAMQQNVKGIMIDGFPRCEEQLDSWARWPFQETIPLEDDAKPDVVLLLNVARDEAEARYLARGRDRNDSADKFSKRFAEYLEEGPVVEKHYREAGLLVEIDNNGTKEESIANLRKQLGESPLWCSAIAN